jgi:hypothetical protein
MDKFAVMTKAFELRQTADLCKRLAEIPTNGGHRVDQVLNVLAEKLYREADEVESTILKAKKFAP